MCQATCLGGSNIVSDVGSISFSHMNNSKAISDKSKARWWLVIAQQQSAVSDAVDRCQLLIIFCKATLQQYLVLGITTPYGQFFISYCFIFHQQKADIALPGEGEPHLRATGRHLQYGITQCCLPSERAPPNPSHACRYSIYLPRRDGRLSWPIVDLIMLRPGVEPATFRSRVRRRTVAPPRQPKR